ncbi:MAG: antitermination protein NusG [Planctomycetes bacterium]|nr:antitermination protein NusG [Planctomycetota bacterium]
MPILELEPSIFPDGLLSDPALNRDWWAVYTKPRQEKSMARELLAGEQPFYLPLVARRQIIRGRVRISHLPLFPGYLFLAGDHEGRLLALQTNRAVCVLPVPDASTLVQQLSDIRRLLESGMDIERETALVPGRRIRVRHGPLAGLEGTIIRRHGGDRFVVAIDFLQQGASVEISEPCLEVVI